MLRLVKTRLLFPKTSNKTGIWLLLHSTQIADPHVLSLQSLVQAELPGCHKIHSYAASELIFQQLFLRYDYKHIATVIGDPRAEDIYLHKKPSRLSYGHEISSGQSYQTQEIVINFP